MLDIINLAVPYFSLIFVGYACGKVKALPEAGLAWMNFFLLYVSLPALLFVIMSKTPFAELNNPPFLIATTLATSSAFIIAMAVGRIMGSLSLREATLAGLSGAYGNIGYMGPGLALAVLGPKAAAPTALIFCCDSNFLFSVVPLLVELTDRDHPSLLHAFGVVLRQIVLNPLIMSACAGALAAALHIYRRADGVIAAGSECVRDRASERNLDRAGVGCGADRDVRFLRHADQRDVVHSDRPAGVSLTSAESAWGRVRQDGASPSRMASRRRRPNEPIRCRPAARMDCTGRKSLSRERFARSITKVRLSTSGRRVES
jgi:hypothetical protein